MGPDELIAELRAELKSLASPVVFQSIQRFFKEPVKLYGLKTAQVRTIARSIVPKVKDWTPAQRNRFANELWKSGMMEECGIAVEVYSRFLKQCGLSEFHLFEKWIDRYVHNWAHCDITCGYLISPMLLREPELVPEVLGWAKSPNRWKRRASAVSLIEFAKRGERTVDIFKLSRVLLSDGDEMVQKGVGWLLKVAYPKRPGEVVEFLQKFKGETTRLVLRYAAEKMTPAHKSAVLQ